MKKKWNKALAEALANKGVPAKDIAKRCDVTVQTVYAHLKTVGVTIGPRAVVPDQDIIAHMDDLDAYAKEQGYVGRFQLLAEHGLPPVWSKGIHLKTSYPLVVVRHLWAKGLKLSVFKHRINLIHSKSGKWQDIAPLFDAFADETIFWSDPIAWLTSHAQDISRRWRQKKSIDI